MIIKAGTECPYKGGCIYSLTVTDEIPPSKRCGHKGVEHPVDFQCDVAEGYRLEEKHDGL